MSKYIDAEKLIAEIESRMGDCKLPDGRFPTTTNIVRYEELSCLRNFITSLQQEQPKGNLEYWLEHFGMPKENIDNCITQIAQGYGACRYPEGIQHGAEAVNELAKQEQLEVDLEKFDKDMTEIWGRCAAEPNNSIACLHIETFNEIARHFYKLGQRTKYQQDREEFAKLKAKEWQEGYDEGYAKGLNARKEEKK